MGDSSQEQLTRGTFSLVGEALTTGYGQLKAISGVSIEVRPGQIVGLLGPNGAGKTTVLRSLAGFLKPWNGRVIWNGVDISHRSLEKRVRDGIVMVQEGRHLFGSLTVNDNLLTGGHLVSKARIQELREMVLELFPAIVPLLQRKAGNLSGGEQQMVAIGRALMSDPSYLLVDEPSLGLAPKVVEQIYIGMVEMSRSSNVGVVVVEQEVARLLTFAEHLLILGEGSVVASKSASYFETNRDELVSAYFGKRVSID